MLWEAISNTRKSFSLDIQTLRSWFKKLGYASFFNPLHNVWISDEKSFFVFDILHLTQFLLLPLPKRDKNKIDRHFETYVITRSATSPSARMSSKSCWALSQALLSDGTALFMLSRLLSRSRCLLRCRSRSDFWSSSCFVTSTFLRLFSPSEGGYSRF